MEQPSIDNAGISQLIPHAGNMVLLDEINHWNNDNITATVFAKPLRDNPLIEASDNNTFNSLLLIEYAAQAAAVHAALLASGLGAQRPAYIGATKNINIQKNTVEPTQPITIHAEMLLANSNGAIYQIDCQQNKETIINAKLILSQPA